MLIKVADASEDVRVDPDLQKACQKILAGTCNNRPGKGRVIDCLLEQINKDEMTEDCEERLLEIQFFVTRDWRYLTRTNK
jgi:Golgi apparatus protein 1